MRRLATAIALLIPAYARSQTPVGWQIQAWGAGYTAAAAVKCGRFTEAEADQVWRHVSEEADRQIGNGAELTREFRIGLAEAVAQFEKDPAGICKLITDKDLERIRGVAAGDRAVFFR